MATLKWPMWHTPENLQENTVRDTRSGRPCAALLPAAVLLSFCALFFKRQCLVVAAYAALFPPALLGQLACTTVSWAGNEFTTCGSVNWCH